jgi:regulatory protein
MRVPPSRTPANAGPAMSSPTPANAGLSPSSRTPANAGNGPGTNLPTVHERGPSLRARALRYLARREHSREELRRKLVPYVAEGDDLEAVLDEIAARGWLSDVRFAEQAIRAGARRFGPIRLARQLRERGVDEEAIAAGFHAAGQDGVASIESVWRSRYRARPANERERVRQIRFLQGRGFTLEDVLRFLKNHATSDEPQP